MSTGFEPLPSEVHILRQQLLEEQETSRKAQLAQRLAEDQLHHARNRLHIAQRERDAYKLLARRWQARLRDMIMEQHGEHMKVSADSDEDDVDFYEGRQQLRISGLSAAFWEFERNSESSSDEEVEEASQMDDEMNIEGDSNNDGSYSSSSENEQEDNAPPIQNTNRSFESTNDRGHDSSVPTASPSAVALRPQVRSVSDHSDDS